MKLQAIRSFVARGNAFRGEVSVPVTITGSYDSLGYEPVRCTVALDTPPLVVGSAHLETRRGVSSFLAQLSTNGWRTTRW
jgi:hypothetical protein